MTTNNYPVERWLVGGNQFIPGNKNVKLQKIVILLLITFFFVKNVVLEFYTFLKL